MPKQPNSPRRSQQRLVIRHLAPIREADIRLTDLTVLVGPQATGKSIFLQTLKLVQDRNQIHTVFARYNVVFNGNADGFFGGYYGKGMRTAWHHDSSLTWGKQALDLTDFSRPTPSGNKMEKVFFIPAQRVMSLAGGVTQNFGQFNYGDPYALRYFSDVVHDLVQNEFGAKGDLFPQTNRLNAMLRKPIEEHLFAGSRLGIDDSDFTKKLVIKIPGHDTGLPYTAWSAGQREFTPLLLGIYRLCPSGGLSRRASIETVIIEEPEMGLHPQAIVTVLLLILELLRRQYRVVVSTHSTTVLDLVWTLREFQTLSATADDVRALFDLDGGAAAKELAGAALQKQYSAYFFGRDGYARDISGLDPGAENPDEALWGGLAGFSAKTGEILARVVNRYQSQVGD